MSRTTLTKREQDTLVAIQTFMKMNHYPPTIKEIGALINVTSTSTVSRFLIKLEQKGYITREESKPRSTRIQA